LFRVPSGVALSFRDPRRGDPGTLLFRFYPACTPLTSPPGSERGSFFLDFPGDSGFCVGFACLYSPREVSFLPVVEQLVNLSRSVCRATSIPLFLSVNTNAFVIPYLPFSLVGNNVNHPRRALLTLQINLFSHPVIFSPSPRGQL